MLQTAIDWSDEQVNTDNFSFFEKTERVNLQEVVEETIHNLNGDLEDFILLANLTYEAVPRRIRQQLMKFKRFGNSLGGLLVRGLPTDPKLPVTPCDQSSVTPGVTIFSEFLLVLFSTPFGEPFGYAQEKGGRLFHHVFPTQHNESARSSESSKIELDFHTENTFHPYIPDYVFLCCLRQDPEGKAQTRLASIQKILPLLTKEESELLYEPIFETKVFGKFASKKGQMVTFPILYGNRQSPYFRYDKFMQGKTLEAACVLDKITTLVNQVAFPIYLQSGDLLIIDNKSAVHARTSFPAYYNGRDRWLQRLLVSSSFAASAQDRWGHNRIIHTVFNGS